MILHWVCPISPADNTDLCIQRGGGLESAAQEGAYRTRGTQARQSSSLALLSKYSNHHEEKAIPFCIQQYLASADPQRSLFFSSTVWAAVKGGALEGRGSSPSDFPTCPPNTASHTETEQWGGEPGTGQMGPRGPSCASCDNVTWQRWDHQERKKKQKQKTLISDRMPLFRPYIAKAEKNPFQMSI